MARAIAAAVAAAFIAWAVPAFGAQPPGVGSVAPPLVLPIVVNGHGTLILSALRGHPVYLNFFASWCDPCKGEAPVLQRLSSAFKQRGVIMVGVDTLDTVAGARAFVKHYGLPYAIVADSNEAVGAAYGVATLPVQVLIDADGKVALWRAWPTTYAEGVAALARLKR